MLLPSLSMILGLYVGPALLWFVVLVPPDLTGLFLFIFHMSWTSFRLLRPVNGPLGSERFLSYRLPQMTRQPGPEALEMS